MQPAQQVQCVADVGAVLGEGPARDMAERFDGEVQPGVIDTPPVSGYVGACLP